MVKYILKRLVQLVVVLLGVTFLTFMITQAAPSDAAEMKCRHQSCLKRPGKRWG